MDNALLREFLAETEDSLELLFGDLQTLRARRGEGRARRELVDRIFRLVHTMKGASATAGLEAVAGLAHEFETLLDAVRLGRAPLTDEAMDTLDAAAAAIAQSVRSVAQGQPQADTRALLERLRGLAQAASEADTKARPAPVSLAIPEEIARSLSRHETHRLREILEEGAGLFVVGVQFDLSNFDARFRNLSDALAEDGEIISTLPGTAGVSPDRIGFRIIYATRTSREELSKRVGAFGEVSLAELMADKASKKEKRAKGADASALSSQPQSIVPLTAHLRVELDALDALIASAHETLREMTSALDFAQSLVTEPAARAPVEERAEVARRRFLDFEEELIALRMVPVAQMLERAARAGRMAAKLTGKEVEFEVGGRHVRLDKALADTIADPLLHILRNAVDHGIERPAERTRIGKKRRGLVRLEALAEGNRVVFRVADDGRGIDPLRITRAAAAQGIIAAGRLLTKEQCLRLIFRPGFSTAASVSRVSGRGVGLDVVERAVEQVGGQLHVASEQGAGTTFDLVLPMTLALLPSLVINSAGYRYCVDASRVLETGFIAAGDVERNINAGGFDWRGERVPLVEMRKLLAHAPMETRPVGVSLPVIIISHGGRRQAAEANGQRRTAIIVDALEGHTEALVRGLGRHAARWRGVSGATELRDGTLALVLDLPRLLEMGQ